MKFQKLQRQHRPELDKLLREIKNFSEEEVRVCLEIADEVIEDVNQTDYHFDCAFDDQNRLMGFVSYGEAALADRVWEVYWVAVDPARTGEGLGKKVLGYGEEKMRAAGARMSVIETSGRKDYADTNRFYLRCGYTEAARIKDFYREGDDLVMYRKDFEVSELPGRGGTYGNVAETAGRGREQRQETQGGVSAP